MPRFRSWLPVGIGSLRAIIILDTVFLSAARAGVNATKILQGGVILHLLFHESRLSHDRKIKREA